MCRPLNKCRSGRPPRRPPYHYATDFVEIAIAKVLLNTKPRRVGKFRGCRFSDVLRKCGEKKKKYTLRKI